MSLREQDGYYYGDEQADLHEELQRYAEENGYKIHNLADCSCQCGARLFELHVDELQGVGARVCTACGHEHVMGDGGHYLDEAELEPCECLCGATTFELTVGVSRYLGEDDKLSDDVRWLYIGCRCPDCQVLGCYADWKNEFHGFQELLDNV